MMKTKWLAGLGFCALSAGAIALAQEPPAQPPPPPAQGEPVQRPGIRVKAPGVDVQVPRRDEETVDPNAQAQPQQPVTYHRAKQILGTKVAIQGDLAIGTVEDIVFSDDGRIEYMVVANEGKFVSVPWDAARFNFEQRTAVVGITQERFRQIPTFTAESYPRFADPQWRTTTYGYYDIPVRTVTPRQDRRIDRAERKADRIQDRANRRP
ncbi:MAG TPA: PRC-barrel domain-containing protein [Planctomycetia bacterium]|nr:PRC-barrel domain-containing protein [Planctomycetia bacterium]